MQAAKHTHFAAEPVNAKCELCMSEEVDVDVLEFTKVCDVVVDVDKKSFKLTRGAVAQTRVKSEFSVQKILSGCRQKAIRKFLLKINKKILEQNNNKNLPKSRSKYEKLIRKSYHMLLD